jgi:uncharacterized protein YbaP (TraB family)
MLKEKLVIGLFFFLFLAPLFVFGQQNTSNSNHRLLWRVTGKGIKKPCYIFGTYHSNDPRVFQFTDSAYAALYKSEAVVIEADLYSMFASVDTRIQKENLVFDSKGKPSTSNRRATKTRYGNEDGRPQFLDLYLQLYAYNSGKKCFALESIADQLAAYEMLNKSIFPNLNSPTEQVTEEKLIDFYQKGDIESLRKSVENQLKNTKDGYQWLINERNYVMMDGFDTLSKQYGVFMAVGAAHLSGKDGLIQLLRDRGYKLLQVAASFNGEPSEIVSTFHQQNHFIYRNESSNLMVEFGGKPLVVKEKDHIEVVYQEMGQGNTYRIEIEPTYKNFTIERYVESMFNAPEKASIRQIRLKNGIIGYEGISQQYGVGMCWMRIFIYNDKFYKVYCYGGNKFMNSKRYLNFFEKVSLF